jgi:hypothetical protein
MFTRVKPPVFPSSKLYSTEKITPCAIGCVLAGRRQQPAMIKMAAMRTSRISDCVLFIVMFLSYIQKFSFYNMTQNKLLLYCLRCSDILVTSLFEVCFTRRLWDEFLFTHRHIPRNSALRAIRHGFPSI